MQNETHEICSKPLGKGIKSQVYKIKEKNPPYNVLIGKIYENKRKKYYEREKKILQDISNPNNTVIKDYLVHIKNVNARLRTSNLFTPDSTLLTFDFLIHGNISDYISLKELGRPLSESYTKLLGYKLLLGLKKCHENNISHNKIDIRNIMFDDNFDPIIIHFGDAKISNDYQKDFVGLGIVLTGLMTSNHIISYKFSQKLNKYIFRFNKKNNLKESSCEESDFWQIIEKTKNIRVSSEFMDFFHKLASPDKIVKIDDLLDHEWLNDVKKYKKEIEKSLKEEFKINFILLSKSREVADNYKNNISNMINLDEINEAHTAYSLIDEIIKNENMLDKKR